MVMHNVVMLAGGEFGCRSLALRLCVFLYICPVFAVYRYAHAPLLVGPPQGVCDMVVDRARHHVDGMSSACGHTQWTQNRSGVDGLYINIVSMGPFSEHTILLCSCRGVMLSSVVPIVTSKARFSTCPPPPSPKALCQTPPPPSPLPPPPRIWQYGNFQGANNGFELQNCPAAPIAALEAVRFPATKNVGTLMQRPRRRVPRADESQGQMCNFRGNNNVHRQC